MQDPSANAKTGATAFTSAQANLRERLQTVSIDAREFQQRLSRCSLENCRGMCCYDGVPVDDDTAHLLRKLSIERADDFREMGLALPREVIVDNQWRGVVSKKTAVQPFPFRSLVKDFPDHFEETACVFHLDDGRCGLQLLSERDGKHPWFYKPFACWLHPIKITGTSIHLYDETTDPNRYPDYDGYVSRTFCGRRSKDGCPAADLLRDELQYLEHILDRDLLTSLKDNRKADNDHS